MSRFVEECRKEWDRLGVPEDVRNEMTADLAADLAEAEAEGATPEHVLGNGVFDPRSFAASWATARGVVPLAKRAPRRMRWWVVAGAVASFVVVLVGLAILARPRQGSVAVAMVRRALPGPFVGPPGVRIGPGLPGHFIFLNGAAFNAIGAGLLLVGLLGLGLILWYWRPWSMIRRRSNFDDGVGLPSFL